LTFKHKRDILQLSLKSKTKENKMPEIEEVHKPQQDLESALDVQRQRLEAHNRPDFNFGEAGYRPRAAGELRMMGSELKDRIRVIRAKRALDKSR
jgi:hypothetical protein